MMSIYLERFAVPLTTRTTARTKHRTPQSEFKIQWILLQNGSGFSWMEVSKQFDKYYVLSSQSFQSTCLIGGKAIFLGTCAAVCNLWLFGRLRRPRFKFKLFTPLWEELLHAWWMNIDEHGPLQPLHATSCDGLYEVITGLKPWTLHRRQGALPPGCPQVRMCHMMLSDKCNPQVDSNWVSFFFPFLWSSLRSFYSLKDAQGSGRGSFAEGCPSRKVAEGDVGKIQRIE